MDRTTSVAGRDRRSAGGADGGRAATAGARWKPAFRGTARFGVAAAALALATSCGSSGSGTAGQASATASNLKAIQIVALGDSDATGIGDATGHGWVGAYGDLITRKLNRQVIVDNRAREGKTSAQLRSEVTSDGALRQALRKADVILIGIGGADLNTGDDALSAGNCTGRQCYVAPLRTFDENIKAITSEVRKLAPAALLRAISLPNAFPGGGDAIPSFATADIGTYQVVAERASVCQAMRSNNGQCVDVVGAFNGANADRDAYITGLMTKDPCCYPSSKGQLLIAQLLAATGFGTLQAAR